MSYLHEDEAPAHEDDPPPNRLYAEQRADAIRFHHRRGMSWRTLETIYGRTAVLQVLGDMAAP